MALRMTKSAEQVIETIGGERLAGSGFENEEPEVEFAEVEE